MKRVISVISWMVVLLFISGCQQAPPPQPEFRSLDSYLQYRIGDGEWITLYDFSDLSLPVEILDLEGDVGEAGEDGISVVSAQLSDAKELIFTYSNGEQENVGCVAELSTTTSLLEAAWINDVGELILQTSQEEVNVGVVIGPRGPRGYSGPTGATGPNGQDGVDGLTIVTSTDEVELFALTEVEEVDMIVLAGDVVVSGLSTQIINDQLILDFHNKEIHGDLMIETLFSGVVELQNGVIDGNLTVSGLYATFNNYLTVTGEITISAVSPNTWNQYGDVTSIIITTNGGTFNFVGGTIADCVRVSGDAKTKTLLFKGNGLHAPVIVEAASRIVFDESMTNQVDLSYSSETVREDCCIINNTPLPISVNGSEEVDISASNVFIEGKPGLYLSIQSGIDAASLGDTVYVGAGEYTEHIIIDKPLNLIAIGDVVIQNPTVGAETLGIYVLAGFTDTTTITGFTLRDFRNSILAKSVAHIYDNVIYAENYGEANAYLRNGIQIGSTDGSRADSTLIENNTIYGAPLTDNWSGTAINVVNGSHVIVRENTILGDNDVGICVLDFNRVHLSGVQILNNVIVGSTNSVRIDGWYTLSPYAVIENITVSGNEFVGTTNEDIADRGINMNWVKLINSEFMNNTYADFDLDIRVSSSSASTENVVSDDVDVQAIINIEQSRAGYHTLQSAIDMATSGQTITIYSGLYIENITVDKDLILQGIGEVIVQGTITYQNEAILTLDNVTTEDPVPAE